MTSHSHNRSDWSTFERAAPEVVAALSMLGKAVDNAGLDKSLTELVKIRASQLNGCAFCLQFHLNIARKTGLAAAKIDLVATWRDAGIYTEREAAALAWTEALTLMSQQPVPDALYDNVSSLFTPQEVIFLTSAIGAINAWNRIAGALQFAPPLAR
ncbi:AhpD family alkylhydroperoxidase [Pantoea allii]|uniref:AhpD family alkylhydroperoxidase n=1 Tax=Pantoea allii TaxID=574096 RepID=A0A2V2BKU4_9GAMM|nr:carboxymuconolactone decarboxylase family protein [Pantoea allii]MDJ0037088.1 carboxymuconolactone decarboxylase family protein [Pantoea allii]MDJ0090850.1 carboxymuconolactone decarboxylase family protein [Pantoea allii]PWL00275.1 AhpD family alkylhydroperoxidase [Pantoea allii]